MKGKIQNIIIVFQHEKKYEILLAKAKELELDERAGCLLQVQTMFSSNNQFRMTLQVVALFANDGAVLLKKEQVERLHENFCILLFR